ncbi:MAM and LDL-receptor class A domain-containing protein 1-like isoform X2 [Mizuhopecten yessoensis]|uniref:MAM and LDL-receptor class A domain-containing protein 1-like isoform X2 n=1 Tax=Mizuhopecten yessoensis TaxID=6573 RepID=UPI000B45F099|nr:MAM and LDL-receptor class A domain-containing protein 1-like isoform X2 [Mizuhopecten yessoensis]
MARSGVLQPQIATVDPENIESCDFEDGEFCGWEQDKVDDFDWSRQSGKTTTGRTGPDSDHTLGPTRLDGHYIYMESSAPRIPGHVARLLSPVYQQSKSGRCFRFWYHMKGPEGLNLVGSLTISLRVYNGSLAIKDDVLFTVKENQGPDWREGQVFIYKTDKPFRIVLTATRQESYISDIAVDDISLYDCQGVITTTEPSSTEVTSQTEEMGTTEMTTVSETTQLSTTEETTAPTGHDVTSTYPKSTSSLPVSTTLTKLHVMTSSSKTPTLSNMASVINTGGSDVIDLSTPISSSFSGYISENTDSIRSKPTSDSSDLNKSLTITTDGEDSTEEVTTSSFDNISDTVHAYRYTPKPGVKQYVLQNKGVVHSVSFVVSLTLGIAVIVIGALVIAFIVRRIKKRTKHYTDDDFETMHTATYRKQSTDGLIL